MRTSILTESVADTHSFVSGCHLRECYVLQKNILRHAVATLKRIPKASSIASTKQTLYNARTSLRIVCPSRDGKANDF